jgi:hypothetical protein
LVTQVLVECRCEFGVSVMYEISLVQEEATKRIDELPGTLHHECLVRMGRYPCKMDASCFQFHHHQDVVGDLAMPGGHFHREKVRSSRYLPNAS